MVRGLSAARLDDVAQRRVRQDQSWNRQGQGPNRRRRVRPKHPPHPGPGCRRWPARRTCRHRASAETIGALPGPAVDQAKGGIDGAEFDRGSRRIPAQRRRRICRLHAGQTGICRVGRDLIGAVARSGMSDQAKGVVDAPTSEPKHPPHHGPGTSRTDLHAGQAVVIAVGSR